MKEYKVKPRHRHKMLANEIIKQIKTKGKVNEGKAMRDAGYSESFSKTPCKVTNSKGFKAIAEEAGLTQENIAKWLYADIKTNAGKRVPELNLATKLLGMQSVDMNIDVTHNETVDLLRGIVNERQQRTKEEENEE